MTNHKNWKLDVFGDMIQRKLQFSYQDFESMTDSDFNTDPYLDQKEAEVVPLKVLFKQISVSETPTHIVFYGSDQFIAEIRFNELVDAFFLFKENGKPIQKAYPLRLYVPGGSSECLNVKSIVRMELRKHTGQDIDKESTYGFKSTFSPDELLKN